jgi:hypothetical protein
MPTIYTDRDRGAPLDRVDPVVPAGSTAGSSSSAFAPARLQSAERLA